MTAPYIPTKDGDLDAWANNFADLITATPALYGLTPAEALSIQTEVDAWNVAYPLAINPGTRTPVTVSAKNAAKIAMTIICRTFASQVRINPGVADADKLDLGLNLPNNSPSPIPTPPTFPLLDIASAGPLIHVMRFADNTTPDSRRKPDGAVAMQLFAVDSGDLGETASYAARWVNRKGEPGPWSAPISFVIAG
jgi:hypothetical protein